MDYDLKSGELDCMTTEYSEVNSGKSKLEKQRLYLPAECARNNWIEEKVYDTTSKKLENEVMLILQVKMSSKCNWIKQYRWAVSMSMFHWKGGCSRNVGGRRSFSRQRKRLGLTWSGGCWAAAASGGLLMVESSSCSATLTRAAPAIAKAGESVSVPLVSTLCSSLMLVFSPSIRYASLCGNDDFPAGRMLLSTSSRIYDYVMIKHELVHYSTYICRRILIRLISY